MVDTSPDGDLHQVTEHLFIGSQDASSNISELKNKKITHILNLAACPNYFEKVCISITFSKLPFIMYKMFTEIYF